MGVPMRKFFLDRGVKPAASGPAPQALTPMDRTNVSRGKPQKKRGKVRPAPRAR